MVDSRIVWLEFCKTELETRCANLECWCSDLVDEVWECHQVNPRVTIDLTQGGDGDGDICYPSLIFI